MSTCKHRVNYRLIGSIIVSVVVIGLITTLLADVTMARALNKNLPKPYILNRGDGDTINGKIFIYDSSGSGDLLCPSSPLLEERDINATHDTKTYKRYVQIKWMILYRLIK